MFNLNSLFPVYFCDILDTNRSIKLHIGGITMKKRATAVMALGLSAVMFASAGAVADLPATPTRTRGQSVYVGNLSLIHI